MAGSIPDLEGWEAYCENCGAFREARRANEVDARDGTEYFEFIRNTCHSACAWLESAVFEASKIARSI